MMIFILCLLFILAVIPLYILPEDLLNKFRIGNKQKNVLSGNEPISIKEKKFDKKIQVIENHLSEIQKQVKLLEKELKNIQVESNDNAKIVDNMNERFHFFDSQLQDILKKSQKEQPSYSQTQLPQSSVIYTINFRDGFLKPCTQDKSQYQIQPSNAHEGSFSFCGDIQTALQNLSATFDGVCTQHGNVSASTNIKTISHGRVISQNGLWKVIEKTVIKFE